MTYLLAVRRTRCYWSVIRRSTIPPSPSLSPSSPRFSSGVCDKDYYCNWVVSEFEEEIENWYYHKQQIFTDFANFLCVKKAKLCCPDDHYGPKCEACAALKCSLHGKCQVCWSGLVRVGAMTGFSGTGEWWRNVCVSVCVTLV